MRVMRQTRLYNAASGDKVPSPLAAVWPQKGYRMRFRSAKQDLRLMEVLPPTPGERLKPLVRPTFSPEIVDAEFETVSGNADFRRYPTFNDNRKTRPQSHPPTLPRLARFLARAVRSMESLLQRVSGRSFVALTICVFTLVFVAIQVFNPSGTQTTLAAPPVEPLAIEQVAVGIKVKDGLPMLTLSGNIANRSQTDMSVPDLTVAMADGRGNDFTIEAPVKSLGPGKSAYFEGQFHHTGGKLPKLTVEFATP
jgi:hypothetical protein